MKNSIKNGSGFTLKFRFFSADNMIARNLKKANHAERVGRKATGLNPQGIR